MSDLRIFRVIIDSSSGQTTTLAQTAREASELAAKAAHAGQKAHVLDDLGNEISEKALADLINLGR